MAAKPVTVEERLRDIVKWATSLSRHIQGMTQDQFVTDEKTQHAATKWYRRCRLIGRTITSRLDCGPWCKSGQSGSSEGCR